MGINADNVNKMAEEKIVKDIKKTLKRFEKILMEAFLSEEERQAILKMMEQAILKMMEKHDNLIEDLKSGNAKVTIKTGQEA